MRRLLGILLIALATDALFAAGVHDLGVPAGWQASEYDKHGYDLLNKGDYQNARRYFDAAIRTDPSLWTAYYNRATTFCRQKQWAAALPDLNSTIRLKPSFFTAMRARAAVHGKLGNYKASLADLDNLFKLTIKVSNSLEEADVLNGRAWLRATCPETSIRNGRLAVADAKKACELDGWLLESYIDTLAAACAEAGDFPSAVRYQEQAIAMRKALPQKASKTLAKLKYNKELHKRVGDELAEEVNKSLIEFGQRLELYEQNRPYRDTSY
ncbi:MAG TPA: tetratricopeptide repeat protein [Candidatus Udaeobacter sp.]|nr:tetratricopeptide repeat protein [Candidatus Udaeobacter sp.]